MCHTLEQIDEFVRDSLKKTLSTEYKFGRGSGLGLTVTFDFIQMQVHLLIYLYLLILSHRQPDMSHNLH